MYFQAFGSHEEVTEWVQNIASGLGFVIVKKRAKLENGQMYQINYRCTKGGIYEYHGSGKRKTKTKKKAIVHSDQLRNIDQHDIIGF